MVGSTGTLSCPPNPPTQSTITLRNSGVYVAPSCAGCQEALAFFSAIASIATALPSQLTEYTFGAQYNCKQGYPCNPAFLDFDKENVDFDVSYVDATFLPVVMEPYNKSGSLPPSSGPGNQTGWVGIGSDFATFTTGFRKWGADMVSLFGGTPAQNPGPPQGTVPADNTVAWPHMGLCVTSAMQNCLERPYINTKIPKFPSGIHLMGFSTDFAPSTKYPNSNPAFPNDMWPPQASPPAIMPPGAPPPYNQPNPPPWPATLKAASPFGLIGIYNNCVSTPSTGENYCGWLAGNPNMTMTLQPPNPPLTIITTGNVRALFLKNRQNYIDHFGEPGSGCTGSKEDVSSEYTVLKHIYAWTPFNFNCGAAFNPLYWTPTYCYDLKGNVCTSSGVAGEFNTQGYQNIKKVYDKLQYNGIPFQTNIPLFATMFDPYVALIHGSQYLNSLNSYAYSVDDDVGNFQGEGTGAYIAVGGTDGLPNKNPATFPVHVSLGSMTNGLFFVSFQIGPGTPSTFCNGGTGKVVNDSFVLGAYQNYDPSGCPIYLFDNKGTKYTFKLSYPPNGNKANNFTHWGLQCIQSVRPGCKADQSMRICSGNPVRSPQMTWCTGSVSGYQAFDGGATHSQENNVIQTGPAVPCTPSDPVSKSPCTF
jgi:hypothetical protein